MKYFKELTRELKISDAPESDEMIFPVSQHLGNPAKTLVKAGDKVKVGDVLCEPDGYISSYIHSSVSGKVVKISDFFHPTGDITESIFIENDHLYEVNDKVVSRKDVNIGHISHEEAIEMIKSAGIVGLGGAVFPTHVKLSPPKGKKIDTIILNAAECEQYLTCDERILREEIKDVLLGFKLAAKACNAQNIIIVIEDNKAKSIEALNEGLKKYFPTVKVAVVKTEYPMGAEKILIKKVLGRKVPLLGIPIDVGVVVINVGTAAQIYKTFVTGMPLISRIVTISGQGIKNKGNYRARIGTPIKVFFSDDQYINSENLKVIMGGPMMGLSQCTLDVPVIKCTSGVLVIESKLIEEKNCIRCATCVDKCPYDLLPLVISENAVEKATECMECGKCSYFCPSNIPLVQKIKINKRKYLETKKEAK